MGDIGEERRLGQDDGQPCPRLLGQGCKSFGNIGNDGPHQRLSRQTKHVGVFLASGPHTRVCEYALPICTIMPLCGRRYTTLGYT